MQVLFIVFATFFHLFTNFFLATKKGFICLSYLCTRKLMEVWLRGRKRHTANVLNHPGSGGSNPPASANWLVSSVGLEHDATNVGVGSSSLSRVTVIALWCNG